MTKLIATDLDGTLFYPKSRVSMIPKKNKQFLRKFIDDGGRVVVVSSRHPSMNARIVKKLGRNVDVIGLNGGYIETDGKVIKEEYFEPEAFRKFVYDIRDNYAPKLMMIASKRYSVIHLRSFTSLAARIMYFFYESVQGIYHEHWKSSDQLFFQEISKGEVNKLMILIGLSKKKQRLAKKITEKLQSDYPQYEFMWLNQFIEITPKGCNKASALSFYLDNLGISEDNVAVVGDSGNDVPMFKLFKEHSYCMSHAAKEVKAEASHVIDRVSDLQKELYPLEDSNNPKGKSL